MTIFSSFDIALAEGGAAFDDHQASVSIQTDILQNQAFNAASNHDKQECSDHCPDCHVCHFGHCGIILESSITVNRLSTESNLIKYEQSLISRDFHLVFRPPIAS
jgi:hypothetical protein